MSLEWMLIRGSGLAAFAFLAAATIWGLVLSLGILPRSTKRLTFVHESLSVGALLATVVHMIGLYVHDFVDFSAAEILVPGRSDWRPLAVSWGVVAFYGMVLVIVSFYVRKHIGQRQWRLLHFLSYGIFIGTLVHGIAAGTDTGEPAVMALYVGSAAIVVGLTVLRIAMVFAPAPARKAQPAERVRTSPSGGDAGERARKIAAARAAAKAAAAESA